MGEIRKDNLHESLIEELNELSNIDLSGKQDKTDESLLTESKDLVGAINELFQSANNGKELIANAIGEPVSAEDTFQAMSSDINGLLATFKTNMMNNGIAVESNDKFKQLIDKIATMVEEGSGKGIQYVEGTIGPAELTSVKSFNYIEGTNVKQGDYKYLDLNYFNNSNMVIIHSIVEFLTDTSEFYMVYLCSNCVCVSKSIDYNTSNGVYFNNITTDIPVVPHNQYSTIHECSYYYVGVGEEDTTLRDSLASILQEEGVSVTEEDDMASLITKVDEEFDRQVVPAGNAVASDVLSGKTFINSTGQLVTGTGDLTRMLTTGSQTITVSTSSPPEKAFKKTVNHSFGAVPSNIIIITSNVVLKTDSTTRFTAYNVVLKNGTTAIPYKSVYSSATSTYGGISITNITETTFDISVNATYWATSSNATCTIKVANIIYY